MVALILKPSLFVVFSRKKLIQAWWHYVSSRVVLLCNNFDKMALMSSLLSASLTNCIFAVILLPLFSAWNCVVWRRLIAPCQSCWTLMVNRKRPLWVLYICNLIPSIKSITGMITLSIWQIFWSSVWERERKDDLCGNLRCVEIRLAPTHWAGETFHWRLNRIKVESNEQFGESQQESCLVWRWQDQLDAPSPCCNNLRFWRALQQSVKRIHICSNCNASPLFTFLTIKMALRYSN